MRFEFLGVPIDALTLSETVDRAADAMRSRRRCQHVALNVAKLVTMRSDPELWNDVVNSDLIGIDGMGIILGARLLGLKVSDRVPGIDLFQSLIELCAKEGFRPYLLGATEQVLGCAVSNLKLMHPTLQIAGYRNGYFSPEQDEEVVQAIRNSGADCLFIGLPTPRKERLLAKFRDQFGVSFVMGVGGSFDILAGAISRAPLPMQAAGLEWLYRLYQEPRRMFWRYFSTNLAFAGLMAKAILLRLLNSSGGKLPCKGM